MTGTLANEPGTHRLDEELKVISDDGVSLAAQWDIPTPPAKRFALTAVLQVDDDGFCVTVAQLPGVTTQADSEGEAVDRIKEATLGAIEAYQELGEQIPWRSPEAVAEAAETADKCVAFTLSLHG